MTGPAPDPRRWRALSVTLVAGFMTLLDVSIVSVALPSIQAGLGTDPSMAQWVISGYALTFGLMLVPAGRLGDALGRRRMFLVAMAGFTVCSGLAGAAPGIGTLIAARLAQGLCAGMLAPQNSGLIQNMFRDDERGRAFGFFGAVVGISTAIGPVVGGVILALGGGPDGWRWIFFVNVPIGVVALVLAARLIPRTEPGPRGHLDVVGALLLGGAVFAVLLPLVRVSADGLALAWLAGVGVVLGAAFVAHEHRVVRRGGTPLLDLRLMRGTPGYAAGTLLGTVYFVGFSGIWLVFALFFQVGLGLSPLVSGLAVTPFALGSAVSAVFGGRLIERFGRRLTVTGLAGVLVGLAATAVVLVVVPDGTVAWAIGPTMLLAGLGGGLVISPNITMTLRCVPVATAGAAGGALQTGQRIGAAIGTAALPGAFYAVLAATGQDYRAAMAVALAAAVLAVTVALVVAVVEWRHDRRPVETAGETGHHGADHHGAYAHH